MTTIPSLRERIAEKARIHFALYAPQNGDVSWLRYARTREYEDRRQSAMVRPDDPIPWRKARLDEYDARKALAMVREAP